MTNGLKQYRIVSEPRQQAFEALLGFCAAHGAYGTLVDLFPASARGRQARTEFLRLAEPLCIDIQTAEGWPIGEPQNGVVGKAVPIWKFAISAGSTTILASAARGLYDWTSPKLPEDLAVYREDGSVLLGTVCHEHIGWLNLSSYEATSPLLGLVELEEVHRR